MRFADTSFWYALGFREGSRSTRARQLWSERGPVLTSTLVLGETWTLIRRRQHHAGAVRTIDGIQGSGRVQIVHCDPAVETEAWRWLRRHNERQYSFVDATSFAIMRRRRIREALAFDGDFAAAGFVEARPADPER